jgi:hypothetical protein
MKTPNPLSLVGYLSVFTIILTACSALVVNEEGVEQNEKLNAQVGNTEQETEVSSKLELITGQEPPSGAESQFSTDFSIHIDYTEILSGGPPKDGIPAIDNPTFVSVDGADEWLEDIEPIVLFEHLGEVRVYPIQILIWHEIVNDVVGGEAVAITFCPLCNTAIAFSGIIDGESHTFGTTGRLHYSNLIMYDRQTETWWQQASGQAIAGELTGTQLAFLPASIVSWGQFKNTYPDALVLSKETGYSRPYGQNPYAGYDDVSRSPFLYVGPDTPDVLAPVARVITVDLNGEAVAYPYDVMAEVGVVNDSVGGTDIVVIWQTGVASALDVGKISAGRDIGTASVFSRVLDGKTLTFSLVNGEIVDDQTNSVWNVLGHAISGELSGKSLEPIVAINHFWFSWAAFKPETRVYQP